MGNLTKVQVDFATSHLIFPTLVGCILAALGLAILIRERRAILASPAMWRDTFAQMDKVRFFGTLVLTIVYFSAMVPVGDLRPNTGFGFLACSVPYVLLTGLLFMQERTAPRLAVLAVVSIVAPLLVWWLFGDVFFLTLP